MNKPVRLRNVYDNQRCRHTGMTIMLGNKVPSPFRDTGLEFIKVCDAYQILSSGQHVIFGSNDLVEVL